MEETIKVNKDYIIVTNLKNELDRANGRKEAFLNRTKTPKNALEYSAYMLNITEIENTIKYYSEQLRGFGA